MLERARNTYDEAYILGGEDSMDAECQTIEMLQEEFDLTEDAARKFLDDHYKEISRGGGSVAAGGYIPPPDLKKRKSS